MAFHCPGCTSIVLPLPLRPVFLGARLRKPRLSRSPRGHVAATVDNKSPENAHKTLVCGRTFDEWQFKCWDYAARVSWPDTTGCIRGGMAASIIVLDGVRLVDTVRGVGEQDPCM